MTRDEFQRVVFQVAIASLICEIPVVHQVSSTSIKLRIGVTSGGFIDAFHNEQTGTTAYAWVHDSKRVYGADNTGGWHVHPLDDPERHDALPGQMHFSEFVAEIEQHAK
ncbi:MAG: hypothetical protein H6647_03805 [Anaerolineales bacterium]|nr:hypothetical protein [Anaerolineales bacterium]